MYMFYICLILTSPTSQHKRYSVCRGCCSSFEVVQKVAMAGDGGEEVKSCISDKLT